MACNHSENCELYTQFSMVAALRSWKSTYCEGEYESCARRELLKDGKPVPRNLLPNGSKITAPEIR